MLSALTSYLDAVKRIAKSWFQPEVETEEEVKQSRKRHREDDEVLVRKIKHRRSEDENSSWEPKSIDNFLLPLNEISPGNSISKSRKTSLEIPESPVMYRTKKHSLPMASVCRKENVIDIDDDNDDYDDYVEDDGNYAGRQISEEVEVKNYRGRIPKKEAEDIQVIKVVAPKMKHPKEFVITSKHKPEGEIYIVPTRIQSDSKSSSPLKCSQTSRTSSFLNSHSMSPPRSTLARKLKLLDESVRLDEKKKYSELLQSYTKVPVGSPRLSHVYSVRCRSPPLSLLNNCGKRPGNKVEVIDLTSQQDDVERSIRILETERKLLCENVSRKTENIANSRGRHLGDKRHVETNSCMKYHVKSHSDVDLTSLRSRSPPELAGRLDRTNTTGRKDRKPAVVVDLTETQDVKKNRVQTRKENGYSVISVDDDDDDDDDDCGGKEAKKGVAAPVVLVNAAQFRERLKNCPVYDVTWTTDIIAMYRKKERDAQRRLHEEHLKAALKTRESEEMMHQVLEERMRRHMRITEVAVEEGPVPVADEDEVKLPELTTEMEKKINAAFKNGTASEILAEAFSQKITRRDLHTLMGTNWLNDEVINFYMNLLMERGKLDNYPSVYCFNTFFYPKLAQSGHASLKRWTRKVDIFSYEILIVPVHLGVHWCLACVKFPQKKIQYYDSMGGAHNTCLHLLLTYLQDESMDKKKKVFDTSGWTTENVQDNPQQMNGSDCGMFSCMYAEYICRGAKITFSQADMPYFRRKMAYEILTKKLLL